MTATSSDPQAALLAALRAAVGARHVLTAAQKTRRFRTGYRMGGGEALAVARPGRLVELWRVLQACVAADAVIIMQAANTGLTGGSTPHEDGYGRPVVVVSTTRIGGVQLVNDGEQAVCLAGATLHTLERRLRPIGREPHSVIGSSCIGASVVGGVCNNSGGALVRRGPAYTQQTLFARLDADGALTLVNHLGIDLPEAPEATLEALEAGAYPAAAVRNDTQAWASDREYARHVRAIDAPTPARFNADPRRLHEASGSAGRVAVFAVRLDTFPAEGAASVFYIGSNDPDELARLRRDILGGFEHLPIAGEYMHRDAFDIAEAYGKDTFLAVRWLGVDRLPLLFAAKGRVDGWTARAPGAAAGLSDRLLQAAARLFPPHLPPRLKAYRDRFEHHLMLKVGPEGADEARRHLAGAFPSAQGDMFECTADEGERAFLHRFVAAGAAVRYRAVHPQEVEDIVALDIALPRNAADWFEQLPPELDATILRKLYYGHFLCNVFHQDYMVRKGGDPVDIEHRMWELLDARGAEYPAEHNVGHLYKAKTAQAAFFRELDPCNRLNPGIGQTSRAKSWADAD